MRPKAGAVVFSRLINSPATLEVLVALLKARTTSMDSRSRHLRQTAFVVLVVASCFSLGLWAIQRERPPVAPKAHPAIGEESSRIVTDPELLSKLNSDFIPVEEVTDGKGPWENYRKPEDIFDRLARERKEAQAKAAEREREDERRRVAEERSAFVKLLGYYGILAVVAGGIGKVLWTNRRKITAPKLKAIYLGWAFLHLVLLMTAPRPTGEKSDGVRSYGSFYPFISREDYEGDVSGIYFNHVEQYDVTEFLFYVLAPLVAWQCRRIWNSDGTRTSEA